MATAKKLLVPALLLALTLAACAGTPGVPDAPPNDNISATEAPADPCACCADCTQKDCTCAKCGDSDRCDCAAPDDLEVPPLAYDIQIETDGVCAECSFDDCGMSTIGRVQLTVDYIDSKTGYFGSTADGSGETTRNGTHELAVKYTVAYGDLPDYAFGAQLSIPGDGTIRFGIDRVGPEEATIDWTAWGGGPHTAPSFLADTIQYLMWDPLPPDTGTAYPDHDAGMLIFELPLADGVMQGTFSWGELSIIITLTPVL